MEYSNLLNAHAFRGLNPVLRFVLGEVFLGFLAIVSAALTLIPMLFNLSTQADALLEAGQWSIILLFAAEYCIGLARASSKRKFVLNPWRVVDAATVLIPLATLLPGASDVLRSSPVLRLVRLARVLALGARAGGVMTREESPSVAPRAPDPMLVRMLPASGGAGPRSASWDEFVQWAKHPGTEWYLSLIHI